MGLERGGLVIALGGGVIGDLAGFAASIVRRGVRFVQMPTTLLAQVDSSVGGKTGINTPQGKNLVGTFHQPSLVLADIGVLATLPARAASRRLRRGGEVRPARRRRASSPGWSRTGRRCWRRTRRRWRTLVAISVRGKADIVARDETETGDRMLLNLGHTFGHALEAWAGYSDRLLHGEAVAIGICLAFQLCRRAGPGRMRRASSGSRPPRRRRPADPHRRHPGRAMPPDAATLIEIMGQDKKVRDGKLTLILVRGIGQAFITRDVPRDKVQAFLAGEIAGTPA